MSAKFWCTVSDRIGRIVERVADHEGIGRATMAGQLLDWAVRSRVASGEYPEEWGNGASELEVDDTALAFLKSLLSDAEPDPKTVAAVAKQLDMSPHDLLAKLKERKGNGSESRITR